MHTFLMQVLGITFLWKCLLYLWKCNKKSQNIR